ncbi:hypothetical protein ACHAWO_001461 [Cyclotella atomus]|uniref:Uncharacterized protein n=1 Tax=Cyclotella atomus TaxID=382360 RepID=A0ABD3QEH2_9STRA
MRFLEEVIPSKSFTSLLIVASASLFTPSLFVLLMFFVAVSHRTAASPDGEEVDSAKKSCSMHRVIPVYRSFR